MKEQSNIVPNLYGWHLQETEAGTESQPLEERFTGNGGLSPLRVFGRFCGVKGEGVEGAGQHPLCITRGVVAFNAPFLEMGL